MTTDESDERQILAHVHGLFRAYVEGDLDAIRRGHTEDWLGFQVASRRLVRGIDAYMEGAEEARRRLPGRGYELLETEVRVHGDTALLYYRARYDTWAPDGRPSSVELRAVDVYRHEPGGWNQAGSNICLVPEAPVTSE